MVPARGTRQPANGDGAAACRGVARVADARVPIADLHTALERMDRGPSPGMLHRIQGGGSNRCRAR